jgi:hypothetical protein
MLRTIAAASVACFALTWASAASPRVASSGAVGRQVAGARANSSWSGWVATAPGHSFSSAAGSWTQPAVDCSAGTPGYSVFWVGLGGYLTQTLEQIGTAANCSGGTASYYAWWELPPSRMVPIRIAISPGDAIRASVSVQGMRATLALDDLTTGRSFSVRPTMARVDVTAAEWIAEAPSFCIRGHGCTGLPFANFGTVAFSEAAATSEGFTSSIGDPAWTAQDLEIIGPPGGGSAAPSPLSPDGSAFGIAWRPAVAN